MKFKNRHAYSPIDELNRENERELLGPFIAPLILGLSILLGIALCMKYADAIDKFSQEHWNVIAWSLFLVPLALIIKKEIKNYWP